MVLQASGPISLQDIEDEFGGSAPISIDEYQSHVGNSAGDTISFSDFYGLSAISVDLVNMSAVSSTISPVDAVATFQITTANGGTQRVLANNTPTHTVVWGNVSYTLSDFECRLTVNSGTSPSGNALNTWLTCDTTRTWSITDTTVTGGSVTSTCTIAIRYAPTEAILDTATITFAATKEV